MSEPQMPTASTPTTTSSLPGVGSGCSRHSSVCGPVYSRAFMGSFRRKAAVDEQRLAGSVADETSALDRIAQIEIVPGEVFLHAGVGGAGMRLHALEPGDAGGRRRERLAGVAAEPPGG